MAGRLNKLTAVAVKNAQVEGMYADGGGLYLQVGASGARSWIFRFKLHGRTRYMGLGPLSLVTLAKAREIAGQCRQLCLNGADPIEHRAAERTAVRLQAAQSMTFDECRDAFIEANKAGWRNAKHQQQWTNTLATYVTPIFGKLPVQAIDTALVQKALAPIWTTKSETAGRVRGRIERILDWAKVSGFRDGENPARWRGHLDKLLPNASDVRVVKHHPALPYNQVRALMVELREREAVAARALEFTILTAMRTEAVLGARWDEIDSSARIWTVPPQRMKRKRSSWVEHRIPLTDAALEVLRLMKDVRHGDFVFPGMIRGRPLSNMAMLNLLQERMGYADATPHGFRASFKTWASECTNFPREVIEAALAHVVGDKVEAAYQRGDLFEKRRALMDAWGSYCTSAEILAAVVPLKRFSV
jgi:integrase